jgi:hypothetical protein
MSLNINLYYGQTVPNINVTGTFTTGSAIIPNEIVTTSTIGTLLNTTALISIGNSNTIGNLFTTGGNFCIGTTSSSQLLTVNGNFATKHLTGNQNTQTAHDTLSLGASGTPNYFLDRPGAGGQTVIGYNTPKGNGGFSPLQVYNGSTNRQILLSCYSAGVSSGSNSVYIGPGFSNLPVFSCITPAVSNSVILLTAGPTILIDNRSGFNPSTGYYTIPVSGYYHVSYDFRQTDNNTIMDGTILYTRSGVSTETDRYYIPADGGFNSFRRHAGFARYFYFLKNDQVSLRTHYYTYSLEYVHFSIYLVTIN